jgi:RNA polymerase sigma factor (sigma-70 family)
MTTFVESADKPDHAPLPSVREDLANECGPRPSGTSQSETIEFARAVERQIPRLRRYARALTSDSQAADDLVQKCLAGALAKSHLWVPGTNLRAWLFTILHNLHFSDLRRSLREAAYSQIGMNLMMAAPRQPDARLELADLDRAISELPEAQRAAVLLVGLEEMTYEQAAAVLSVPIGTVRSRVSRGRAELRTHLLRPRRPKGRVLPRCPAVTPYPGDEDRRQLMSETGWRGRNITGSPPRAAPDKETDQDTAEAVIKAFSAAVHRRLAFEAAVRTYRGHYPGMSEPLARCRVAKILCFAGRTEPQR